MLGTLLAVPIIFLGIYFGCGAAFDAWNPVGGYIACIGVIIGGFIVVVLVHRHGPHDLLLRLATWALLASAVYTCVATAQINHQVTLMEQGDM